MLVKRKSIAVLFVSFMAILCAASAQAEGSQFEEFQMDGMCQDMTGNWVMCTSSAGGGGAAPRMESCVSSFGCQKCTLSSNYSAQCGTAPGENGLCKCTVDNSAQSGCKEEGKCTFRA